jgi:hypothetical protein
MYHDQVPWSEIRLAIAGTRHLRQGARRKDALSSREGNCTLTQCLHNPICSRRLLYSKDMSSRLMASGVLPHFWSPAWDTSQQSRTGGPRFRRAQSAPLTRKDPGQPGEGLLNKPPTVLLSRAEERTCRRKNLTSTNFRSTLTCSRDIRGLRATFLSASACGA